MSTRPPIETMKSSRRRRSSKRPSGVSTESTSVKGVGTPGASTSPIPWIVRASHEPHHAETRDRSGDPHEMFQVDVAPIADVWSWDAASIDHIDPPIVVFDPRRGYAGRS